MSGNGIKAPTNEVEAKELARKVSGKNGNSLIQGAMNELNAKEAEEESKSVVKSRSNKSSVNALIGEARRQQQGEKPSRPEYKGLVKKEVNTTAKPAPKKQSTSSLVNRLSKQKNKIENKGRQ